MDIKAQILDLFNPYCVLDRDVPDFKDLLARLARRPLNLELHRPSNHERGKLLLAGLRSYIYAIYVFATSKDRTAVCNGLYLLELVGDKNNGLPL